MKRTHYDGRVQPEGAPQVVGHKKCLIREDCCLCSSLMEEGFGDHNLVKLERGIDLIAEVWGCRLYSGGVNPCHVTLF
jgi:hypothetical protein